LRTSGVVQHYFLDQLSGVWYLMVGEFSLLRANSPKSRTFSFVFSVSNRSISFNISQTFSGLRIYPSALSLTAFIALSREGCPVIIILIIFGRSFFSLLRSSVPFIPGSSTSIRAASKSNFSQLLIASLPFFAVSTVYPSLLRMDESSYLMFSSSSTTRMLPSKTVTCLSCHFACILHVS